MALIVHLKTVKNIRGKNDKLIKTTFRGVARSTRIHYDDVDDGHVVLEETFDWPIARALEKDEVLGIELFVYNKYLSDRLLGTFNVILQELVEVGHMVLCDSFIDLNNTVTKMVLSVELSYYSPDGAMNMWQKEALDYGNLEELAEQRFEDKCGITEMIQNIHGFEDVEMNLIESLEFEDERFFYDEGANNSMEITSAAFKRQKNTLKLAESSLQEKNFQVNIKVLEAQQLFGLNINPLVLVEVGDQSQFTATKKSTSCPFFDELLVFDFHLPTEMMMDQIIKISVMSASLLASTGRTADYLSKVMQLGTVIGHFKMDVHTVYQAPDHMFYHKWAQLLDPKDLNGVNKGFLKLDISVLGKGDVVKTPGEPKDEDDIEKNLLLPLDIPDKRHRASFSVRIYRAEDLPRMSSGIMANVKKAITGEDNPMADPFVEVSFAGMKGKTSTKNRTYEPKWNEEITFTDLFPTLCHRIKIRLCDNDTVNSQAIGTCYIDLRQVSDRDRDNGFEPTFGPVWMNLYGSLRGYNVMEDHDYLNNGIGEGVCYRGRIQVGLKVEELDISESGSCRCDRVAAMPISENAAGHKQEFLLCATVMEATMIDSVIGELAQKEKHPIKFEFTMGNAGNDLDSYRRTLSQVEDTEEDTPDAKVTGEWRSYTSPSKPVSNADKTYYHMPIYDTKPVLYIKQHFEDHRRRMFNTNFLERICDQLDSEICTARIVLKMDSNAEPILNKACKDLGTSCTMYVNHANSEIAKRKAGATKLDKERLKWCKKIVESVDKDARELLVNKSLAGKPKEKLIKINFLLKKLKFIKEEPQHSLPDVIVWMLVGERRVAFCRVPARTIIHSINDAQRGKDCAAVKTLYLKLPGPKLPGIMSMLKSPHDFAVPGWSILAKLRVYFWLGVNKDRITIWKGLPGGYKESKAMTQVNKSVTAPLPDTITYPEKLSFQLRANLYQGRGLIGSDNSGFSDPFAHVICSTKSGTTEIIYETLSPTWDQTIVLSDLTFYGDIEDIKNNPPEIIIEVYDHDRLGKAEFIGRALATPFVKSEDEQYIGPTFPACLEWWDLHRGTAWAGQLLASFELLQISNDEQRNVENMPPLGEKVGIPISKKESRSIWRLPQEIRPIMSKYVIEVLFWGVRDLQKVQLLSVEKPRVEIQCGSQRIQSSIIANAKKCSNFKVMVQKFEVDLPDNELFCPPITIRCVDCRQFGRFVLVGSHVINDIMKFKWELPAASISEPDTILPGKDDEQIQVVPEVTIKRSTSLSSLITAGRNALMNGSSQNLKKSRNSLHNSRLSLIDTRSVKGKEIADTRSVKGKEIADTRSVKGMETADKKSIKSQKRDHQTTAVDVVDPVVHSEKQPLIPKGKDKKDKKGSKDDADEEEEKIDWWSKYYVSMETHKHEEKKKLEEVNLDDTAALDKADPNLIQDVKKDKIGLFRKAANAITATGKFRKMGQRIKEGVINPGYVDDENSALDEPDDKSHIAQLKVYTSELEALPEFEGFKDWVSEFELHRGKRLGDEDDSKEVGLFKGSLRIYRHAILSEVEDSIKGGDVNMGLFQHLPKNDPMGVLVRLYVVKATDLHPADLSGKADPYMKVSLGKHTINDKENHITQSLNPTFGRVFSFDAKFPLETKLTVQVYDYDQFNFDDLIGETKIDIENRYYSRHRGTCGIAQRYEVEGYNKWRDPVKPSAILSKLCKEAKIEQPKFDLINNKVNVDGLEYYADTTILDEGGVEIKTVEHLALEVLNHWHDICSDWNLLPEHIETRSLYLPDKPGVEQGKLELWVDMFPLDMPQPGAAIDITPRQPKSYELRVIVWDTDDVLLSDQAMLTGEKMSDIYVKGWIKGPQVDGQTTDVHYRSLTGAGNFNWRFIFEFDYMEAENVIVYKPVPTDGGITSLMAFDQGEIRMKPRLNLQVWDADMIGDDCLGELTLDLDKMFKGVKLAKKVNLNQVTSFDKKYTMNLFRRHRTRGWWPFRAKMSNDSEFELNGKVDLEIQLLTAEEAEKSPAGLGRKDPESLPFPNRPDTSFIWFLNPWKSIKYILWNNFKWKILKLFIFLCITALFVLFMYAFPGYMSKRILGA